MKKTTKLPLLAFIIAAAFVPASNADSSNLLGGSFTDSVISARAAGMGGAFTAVADDANASWWNPAGMAFLGKEKSVSGTYIPQVYNDFKGLSDMLISYAQGDTGGFGAIGGSLRYTNAQIDPDFAGDATNKWAEYTALLSWGMQIEKYLGMSKYNFPKISVGVNLKYLGASSDLTLGTQQISASGFSADLAAMAAFKDNFRIGIVCKDIFSQVTWNTGTKESVPYELNAGLYYGITPDFLVSFDLKTIEDSTGAPAVSDFCGGGEYNFAFGKTSQIQSIAIRAGFLYLPPDSSAGFTCGASVALETFSVDYAYQQYFGSQINQSNNRFGLTIYF
jgi:hypothetical protein